MSMKKYPLLPIIFSIFAAVSFANSQVAQCDTKTYLPIVIKDGDIFEGTPKLSAGKCKIYQADIIDLMKRIATNPEQKRLSLTCDPILNDFANRKAEDMGKRSYFSHTDPDGFGPNFRVREAGYPLPSLYANAPTSNNIESIGGGFDSVDKIFTAWLNSRTHKEHMLGLTEFYAAQVEFGIGHYYDANSVFKHYWVLITAYKE